MVLKEKLDLARGRPTGFDYMRLVLSVAVVCIHSGLTSTGSDLAMWTSATRPFVRLILPMFFALSGYLVAGSLLRSTSLFQFMTFRVLRIYPALSVEVLLSALIVGPLLTRSSLGGYFGDRLFWEYLLNVTGDIHYLLPGLFTRNPFPNTVNAQLWTVPFELLCYIAIAALAVVGLQRRRWLGPVSVIVLTLGYTIVKVRAVHGFPEVVIGRVSGMFLLVSFLAGVSLFLYSDRIVWSRAWCLASGVISGLLLSVVPNGDYIAAPFAAYFTVSLGLMNPVKLGVLRGADYSYGVFLYGFVIQQVLMELVPGARVWWLNILLSVPAAAAVAALSWHFIEKPALKLKRFIPERLAWRRNAALEGVTSPLPFGERKGPASPVGGAGR